MSDCTMLTAEDLRDRLYHSFKEKGLVDGLKSQLRQRLVSELRNIGYSQSLPVVHHVGSESVMHDGSLMRKATDTLVVDHLRRSGYDYTLSVFMPECGLNDEKILHVGDLLQLLQVGPESTLYRKIMTLQAEPGSHKEGLLWHILSEIVCQHGGHRQSTAVQTSSVNVHTSTGLEEQMRQVDSYYNQLSSSRPHGTAAEEKILAYQRELEERSRNETKLEIARFKETELSRMRLEEKENYQRELARMKKEVERTYQGKVESLQQRERHAMERMQRQNELQEKETYTQRQSVLTEIDTLRQREAELRRQEEINKREHFLWGEQMRSREELVKGREDAMRRAEIEYEQKLHNEISKFKIEEQSRYMERVKGLEVRECRVQDDERRLSDELQRVDSVKDELHAKRSQVNELETELTRTRHDMIAFEKQNEILSDKCRQMVDYQVMKEENAVLKKELDTTKTRLSEATRDVTMERQKYEDLLRDLSSGGSKPSPELCILEKELGKARSELKQTAAIAAHQKQQLEARLATEMEAKNDLLRRYEEQTEQQKELNAEISDLRQQLRQTRLALSNEVKRKPKQGLNRSGSLCDVIDTQPSLRNGSEPELLFSPTRGSTHDLEAGQTTPSYSEDLSYSFDLVRETKRRLKNLEKEAENLEQNYKNFHLQMTNVPPNVLPAPATRVNLAAPVTSRFGRGDTAALYQSGVLASGRVSSNLPRSAGGRINDPLERPLSSTPARKSRAGVSAVRENEHPDWLTTVSPVNCTPPPSEHRETVTMPRHRPMAMSDLEARPGSPKVVVQPGSSISQASSRDGLPSFPVTSEIHKVADAMQKPTEPADGSHLHSTHESGNGKQDSLARALTDQPGFNIDENRLGNGGQKVESEQAIHEEEENRREEEERKRRAQERALLEEEAWQREQQMLKELQKPSAQSTVPVMGTHTTEDKEDVSEKQVKGEKEDNLQIDPVMQKYMTMVAQQKAEMDHKSKTSKSRKDKTPSASEPDLSLADEEKSRSGGGVLSEDDFEW